MAEIAQWTADGIGFRRVDVALGEQLSFSKVMFDEVVLLSFTNAVWHSEQGGRHELETPDCVVLRDAGQVFSARLGEILDARGSTCRELHFSPARLRELTEERFDFTEPVLIEPALSRELLRVHRVFERDGATLEASSGLVMLLATIAVRTRALVGRDVAACTRRTQWVIEYLRAQFANKITLSELGQLTGISPYVLLRQFQKQTGVSPHDYLSAYRIYRAQQYMGQGLALSDVARRCGFADQSHFNRQFKRRLGVAPRAFRSTSSNTE